MVHDYTHSPWNDANCAIILGLISRYTIQLKSSHISDTQNVTLCIFEKLFLKIIESSLHKTDWYARVRIFDNSTHWCEW